MLTKKHSSLKLGKMNGQGFLKRHYFTLFFKRSCTFEVTQMIQRSATVVIDGRCCFTPLKEIAKEYQVKLIRGKKQVCEAFSWFFAGIRSAK